jgi:hypothetical protein
MHTPNFIPTVISSNINQTDFIYFPTAAVNFSCTSEAGCLHFCQQSQSVSPSTPRRTASSSRQQSRSVSPTSPKKTAAIKRQHHQQLYSPTPPKRTPSTSGQHESESPSSLMSIISASRGRFFPCKTTAKGAAKGARGPRPPKPSGFRKTRDFFKKSPARGGFWWVLWGFIGFLGFLFITIRRTRDRGFRVT